MDVDTLQNLIKSLRYTLITNNNGLYDGWHNSNPSWTHLLYVSVPVSVNQETHATRDKHNKGPEDNVTRKATETFFFLSK